MIHYAFECPVHGLESEVLCWRAFQKENLHRWKELVRVCKPLTEEYLKRLWPKIQELGRR